MSLLTAISLDGAGAHPAAWREPDADIGALYSAERFAALISAAEAAGVDFVTVPDSLEPPSTRAGEIRTRLDALAILARVAPLTDRIGLVPTLTTTHTEPFHLQAAVATLDFVSGGRAGWQPAVSTTELVARHVGRRPVAGADELWTEAGEVIDVSRRLWDSWEDDAEIRDAATGRFIDRERLHYTDFAGSTFSVRGPSIVPRPPQGHPVTVVALTGPQSLPAAATAEVVLVPGSDRDELRAASTAVRRAAAAAGFDPDAVIVLADLTVLLDSNSGGDGETAADRRRRLDTKAGSVSATVGIDHVGTVPELRDLVASLSDGTGATTVQGVHLRPVTIPGDWHRITRDLLPALRTAGLIGAPPPGPITFRERLGLARPENQYAIERRGAIA